MILSKTVMVNPTGKAVKYYRDKGYNAQYNIPIEIKVEDLLPQSHISILIKCDDCGKEFFVKNDNYHRIMSETGKYICKKCGFKKKDLTNLERYGTTNVSALPKIREKIKNTCLEKYGVEHPSQNSDVKEKTRGICLERYGVDAPIKSPNVKEKMEKTNLERYGVKNGSQSEQAKLKFKQTCNEKYGGGNPLASKEVKEKLKNNLLEKYGVENISQIDWVKEKKKEQSLLKYGVENVLQSPEVRQKQRQSLYLNGNVETSSQQKAIYDLYSSVYPEVKLNYPIERFSGDIIIEDIDLEIDYGGHNLSVKIGRLTQEEFNQKQLIRDKIVKAQGYKIVRFISEQRKIPSDAVLLDMLEQTKQYFADHPEHSWREWHIDDGIYRDAEHKEGEPYDYGELNTIKKTDAESVA